MTVSPNDAFKPRFGQYLMERFPPANMVAALVLAASLSFAYAGMTKSLAPLDLSLAAAIILIIGMFFILRVCDEFKDAAEDARYRPSRPVPRGLISLRELRNAAIVVAVVQAFVLLVEAPGLWPLLVATWGWIVLMTHEFGLGAWLRRRPLLYLVSHMLVMPFIAMLAMGVSSGSLQVVADPVAWALALAAFQCGIIMEIGRKIWDEEGEGIETYSKLWGRRLATQIWLQMLAILCVILELIQWRFMGGLVSAIAIFLFVIPVVVLVWCIHDRGTPGARIEVYAIAFVLMAQLILGAGPWLP